MLGAHQACHPFGVGTLVPVSTGVNGSAPLTQPSSVLIESLANQTLRVRILEREPKNIEEALNVASRLEAYDRPIFDGGDDEEQSKGRSCQLRQLKDRRDVENVVNDDIDKLRR